MSNIKKTASRKQGATTYVLLDTVRLQRQPIAFDALLLDYVCTSKACRVRPCEEATRRYIKDRGNDWLPICESLIRDYIDV